MVTIQVLSRLSIFALLLVDVHGLPVKGSKSPGRPSDSGDGDHGGSQQGSATGYASPGFYGTSGGVSKPGKAEKYSGPPQYVQAQSVPVMSSSALPGPGSAAGGASSEPLQGGSVAGSYLPVQTGSLVPLPAAYAASPQSGSQATLPEMEWVIPPQAFQEESANNQPEESSVSPPLPPAPPSLQSGETSNVVKEAELGNYQQQTEEFGYPANMGPGPGLPPVASPSAGVGGLWGYPSPYPLPYPFPYPYPQFDYMLSYGSYPPGIYTTFSKNHEKGKDYYQTIHYSKEHESDVPETQNPGTGQQKVFPGVPQRS